MRKIALQLFVLCFSFAAVVCSAQPSPYSNAIFAAVPMTGTGQTSAAIKMTQTTSTGGGFSVGTVTLSGISLTTATFGVMVSSDNGQTYYPTLIWSPLTPATTATTVTATAGGQFQFSLTTVTHIKFVTSGTFTATSISLLLTATPAPSVSKNGGGGGGSGNATTVNGAAVPASQTCLGSNILSQITPGTGCGGGGSGPAAYTGLVGTRGEYPSDLAVAPGSTWIMSQSGHYVRTAQPAATLQFEFANYYGPLESNPGTGTFKVSLGYPYQRFYGTVTTGSNSITGVVPMLPQSAVGQQLWGNVATAGGAAYFANGTTITGVSGSTVTASTNALASATDYLSAATFTVCTWAGAQTVTAAGETEVTSDGCGPAIPANSLVLARVLYTNTATGVIYAHQDNPSGPALGALSPIFDNFTIGSGTPEDLTAGGSIMNMNNYPVKDFLPPVAILGTTTAPSVFEVGDSRINAVQDAVNDATGDKGELERMIGPSFAYTKIGYPGDTLANFLAHDTGRVRIITGHSSHIIDEFGINDLGGGASTQTVINSRITFAGLFPAQAVFGTTLYSETSSTDNWATTTNQTLVANTDPTAMNAAIRAGIPGELKVIDVQQAFDPTNTNVFPVSPLFGATTGTAMYSTPDGAHFNNVGTSNVAHYLGYVTSWFVR